MTLQGKGRQPLSGPAVILLFLAAAFITLAYPCCLILQDECAKATHEATKEFPDAP